MTVERVAEARLPTEIGEFRLIGYRSLVSNEEFVVIARGQFRAERPSLVRIHSQCLTGDVFGSTKCDCGQQLKAAMKLIADENSGAIAVFNNKNVHFGFYWGSNLADPKGLLLGNGKQYRYIRVAKKDVFPADYIGELLNEAHINSLAGAKNLDAAPKGTTVVKSISPKKKRPASKTA